VSMPSIAISTEITRRSGTMGLMAKPPESTKTSLRQRLVAHAQIHWPQLSDLHIRHRAEFAYVNGVLADGTELPLFRLRYGGSAHTWGFALYLASKDGYQDSFLPTGYPVGTPQEALDCACGLYLDNPTTWQAPPTN
jgi:hypothetical protein